MKKIIDLAQIEVREKKLLEELAELRNFKKYASKFGADYGSPTPKKVALSDVNNISAPHPVVPQADVETAVNAVLTIHGDLFNVQLIEATLRASGHDFSRSSIFEAIAALKENGYIEVISPGAGRRPTQYATTDKFHEPSDKP
jgi:hypothetical protein